MLPVPGPPEVPGPPDVEGLYVDEDLLVVKPSADEVGVAGFVVEGKGSVIGAVRVGFGPQRLL